MGHKEALQLLLTRGAHVKDGGKAVLAAVRNEHWCVALLLLRHGADMPARHQVGEVVHEALSTMMAALAATQPQASEATMRMLGPSTPATAGAEGAAKASSSATAPTAPAAALAGSGAHGDGQKQQAPQTQQQAPAARQQREGPWFSAGRHLSLLLLAVLQAAGHAGAAARRRMVV